MKKNLFLVLLILCFGRPAFPNGIDTVFSKRLGQNSSIYYFKINVFKNQYSHSFYTVNIYKDSISNLMQTISDSTNGGFSFQYPEFGMEFIDINFDGNLDLKFYDYMSADGQSFRYKYWLFNKKADKFIYNKDFTAKLSGTEVYIDSIKNMIIVPFNSGDYEKGQDRYKVVNDLKVLNKSDKEYFMISKKELNSSDYIEILMVK